MPAEMKSRRCEKAMSISGGPLDSRNLVELPKVGRSKKPGGTLSVEGRAEPRAGAILWTK
jgi:hypothetical protein